MAKCRVWGKEIQFITTTNQRKMPTDTRPTIGAKPLELENWAMAQAFDKKGRL